MHDAEPFTPFPKIPRLNREILITEKIGSSSYGVDLRSERARV